MTAWSVDKVTCQRCGWSLATDIILAGMYHTRLCNDCRNDWHLFVNERPEYVQHLETVLVFNHYQNGGARYDWKELVKQDIENDKRMFPIAKAFVEDKIERIVEGGKEDAESAD